MAKKAPRRTALRIAEVTLELFNRFGEPNVSTTLISAELSISPGNLYYHYPSKDALVNQLFDQYEVAILGLLDAAPDVQDVEDAWFFLHSLFEQIWNYRFLYRDLNNLLSGNRHLETHFHAVLERKTHAFRLMLESLAAAGLMRIDPDSIETLSASLSVMVTYWLSYEYVRNPRQAMEPASAGLALTRGARHVLGLLTPYMASSELQAHLQALTAAYSSAPAR
ncbi:TetR family transcriptional regulator [Limnohabitans sp. T6-5]|uniref:TetR/AcrR family transcriptional regulator n=1 Tax=Limnohabitans sp. T6-5 TaxID=1100724 RepID=UPI000D36122A|nr:TetR/AcrR family transcriptional regulator [Limnohabitans sp. T6-5]PUE06354.1 TetR family transcriptional regulator [Limnohabitans sp. T6-5]